ncbi:hypothetical protein [Geobacter anodireducens]|nr:hypothetical protein A2G06_02310 [Geobacter anodireducens]
MNIEFHLIQYIDDPLRGETRNIGIVARRYFEAGFRLIGIDNTGAVDPGCFRALSGNIGKDAWVFGEWIEWFRSLTANEAWEPDLFVATMSELESSGGRIIARKGGVLETHSRTSLDDALNHLFGRLVSSPRPRRNEFSERLEEVLQGSEICYRPDFLRDIEVEFLPCEGKPPETVGLFCLLEKKPRTAFKIVRFRTGKEAFIRQMNDAIYTFEKLVEHGFVEKDRCVILTEAIPASNAGPARRLAEAGHLINIQMDGAARHISSIVRAGSPA